MKTVLEYLRLTLFVGGALIGVQIPSFVDQYGQRLESHMLESQTSLQGFQRDANKYFDGSVERLIQHYVENDDPIINDGGESIESLHSRAQFLNQQWLEFNYSAYQRYWHAIVSPVATIRQDTWRAYGFAVKLDLNGIAWALSFGLILSTLIEFFLLVLMTTIKLISGQGLSNPKPS